MRVFVCSRYAGDVERNVRIAMALCRMVADRGDAPFAPHLLYTQFMDEHDPAERDKGIRLGLEFIGACDRILVYRAEGVSEGMQREIETAILCGVPILWHDTLIEVCD